MLENPNIVLAGFMATGKTRIGRELARLTGFEFVDADRILEERLGLRITDIFRNHGEEKFRERERNLAVELSLKRNTIIATGGGMILDDESRRALESSGELFCLNARIDTIRRRIGNGSSRPLLRKEKGDGRIRAILEERKDVYGSIAQQVQTDRSPPRALAIEILGRLSPSIRRHTVTTPGGGSYPIIFGRGVLDHLPEHLSSFGAGTAVFIITDSNVAALHGDRIRGILNEAGHRSRVFVFPAGEASKTIETVTAIRSFLAGASAQRDSTLMAQSDASIGGKNAVNTHFAKNLIGTFHHPQFVLTDPDFLLTLPEREYRSGFAEVVKTAIIEGKDAFAALESFHGPIMDRSIPILEPALFRCMRCKAGIVSRDPLEGNERKVLNLGHTFGHALEQASDYTGISHGEAVALGIRAATEISIGLGRISRREARRITRLLDATGLLGRGGPRKMTGMIKTMLLDKKARRGKLTVVIPAGIGEVETVEGIETDRLIELLEEADENNYGDPRTKSGKTRKERT